MECLKFEIEFRLFFSSYFSFQFHTKCTKMACSIVHRAHNFDKSRGKTNVKFDVEDREREKEKEQILHRNTKTHVFGKMILFAFHVLDNLIKWIFHAIIFIVIKINASVATVIAIAMAVSTMYILWVVCIWTFDQKHIEL